MDNELDTDRINKILPRLGTSELVELRARITALLSIGGGKGASNAKEESTESWLLGTMCATLSGLGLEGASVPMLSRSSGMAAFRQKLPMITGYLERASSDRTQRQAIFAVGVELLYRNLLDMGLPISAVTVMRHIHRMPAAINAAFPGYAESGYLNLIIKAERKSNVRQKSSERTHAGKRRVAAR